MQHTDYLRTDALLDKDTYDLLKKATGRYYTPDVIGRKLALDLIKTFSPGKTRGLSLIDPFCGDGRLLICTLDALRLQGYRGELEVEGWDLDLHALTVARRNLREAAQRLPFLVSARMRRLDTFLSPATHRFDLVITNPPWDTLKPDRRELASLPPDQRTEYISRLRGQADTLKSSFPHAQPAAKFSGWAQNLARVGTEASLLHLAPRGVCGVVMPATLLADQASATLREWLFHNYDIEIIDFYSAELKLFTGVDQPSAAVTISAGMGAPPTISLGMHSKSGSIATSGINRGDIARLGNRIPLRFGAAGLQLQSSLSSLEPFSSLEGDLMWAGRELDETDHKRFLAQSGRFGFVKGRMVGRFELLEQPTAFISSHGPMIPESTKHWRIAWRDVSRTSQRRRMQATLLPPKMVTGNSLNVVYMRDGNLTRLRWLLGVMNSLVFEFQVRSFSATSHISLGTTRIVKIPPLEMKTQGRIASLAAQRLDGDVKVESKLEVSVAKSYGINRAQFEYIVSSFERLEDDVKSELISQW